MKNRRKFFQWLAGSTALSVVAVHSKANGDDALIRINRKDWVRPSQIATLELVWIGGKWPDCNGWLNVFTKQGECLQSELKYSPSGNGELNLDPECPIDPLELARRLERLTGLKS